MVLVKRKLYFSKDPEGGGGGGSNFFLLISIETHVTCDFQGGSRPLSSLWIRTCNNTRSLSRLCACML